MAKMRLVAFGLLLALCMAGPAARGEKRKVDSAVEPTHRGRVIGRVYDAQTGAPLAGALVSVQEDGAFADRGKSTARTDANGRYQCETMLGRKSSNLDIARLLTSDLILGLVFGGAMNETKRVDVTRLAMRVTCEGHNPFEGVVMCRRLDARGFSVIMEPILLTTAGSPEVSTTAEGWGVLRLSDVSVNPPVLKPGEKGEVSATVQAPPGIKAKDVKVRCAYQFEGWKSPREMDLKPQENAPGGALAYTGKLDAPRNSKAQAKELRVFLRDSQFDISSAGRQKSTLLQVATNDEEMKAATTREEAFQLTQAGKNVEAEEKLKTLCAVPSPSYDDLEALADISQTIHDNDTAISALKQAADITPQKMRIGPLSRYASALVSAGKGKQVLEECAPTVEAIKERDRPDKVPVSLMVALGNAYVQEGKLDEADKISQGLLKWPDADLYSGTADFRNSLRLAQVEAAVKAAPNGAGPLADYGRVLMDQGRWEEAVGQLRASLKTDPNQPAVQRDLAYAELHMQGGQEAAAPNLDDALKDAEKQVDIKDAKGKPIRSKDFFAWHKLAMLLYTKACRLRATSDEEAQKTLEECRDALREALKCGRSGADVNQGLYAGPFGYASPSLVAISGFAYPEANSDFVLRESLEVLEKHPDDYLTQFNLGTALIDLGQPELAAGPIQRALAIRPDFVEGKYALALIDLKQGDRAAAKSLLSEVVKANPRHRHAYLVLARLYTEDGDMSDASACLAAHARMYGLAK